MSAPKRSRPADTTEAERIAENVRILNRVIERRRQELTVTWPLSKSASGRSEKGTCDQQQPHQTGFAPA